MDAARARPGGADGAAGRLGVLRALVKEVSVSGEAGKPLVVGGARELAAVLRRELGRGAKPGAVRADDEPKGGAVYVHVLGGEPTADDKAALKRARRARVPIVAIATGPLSDDVSIPYVLATDVIRLEAGQGFPLDAIARVIAALLGEEGAPLAARVPLLRRAVCARLVASFAKQNGVIGAAVVHPRRRPAGARASTRSGSSCGSSRPTGSRSTRASGCPRSRRRSEPASACGRSPASCSISFR